MLGGDDNLMVFIQSFSLRHLLCFGWNGPPYRSCSQIPHDMTADSKPRMFGQAVDPLTDVSMQKLIEKM